jgi:hypothetical protein
MVGTGDFNGDSRADILWRNTASGADAIWYQRHDLHRRERLPPIADLNWQIVGTGDFDGDGTSDLLWRL